MDELGINMIPAGSPQAKGRIERLWGTLQDRLVQEFSLNKIKDIDDDEYKQFIDKNLDEIVKLINEISSDRTYFYLKMVNVFLT